MNSIKKAVAYLLILGFGATTTGCIGPFKLTNVTYQWNQTIGTKWVNEAMFILFIPVYAVTFLADGLVLNPIEFWSNRPGLSLKEGEQKEVTSADGTIFKVSKTKRGYHFEQVKEGRKAEATFEYNASSKTWSVIRDTKPIRLAQLIESQNGSFVKVFREDGASVLVDATINNRNRILSYLNTSNAFEPGSSIGK